MLEALPLLIFPLAIFYCFWLECNEKPESEDEDFKA